jgi:hypothetical protein
VESRGSDAIFTCLTDLTTSAGRGTVLPSPRPKWLSAVVYLVWAHRPDTPITRLGQEALLNAVHSCGSSSWHA